MSRCGGCAAVAGAALLLALGAGAAAAGDGRSEDHDHDRARQALEAGEILPLRTILDRLEREYPGQVMEVELERKDGRWVYEIKLLRRGGALSKLQVDARDGSLIGLRQRERHGDRH
ncbi:MAG TPA: hypothetical protein DIT03_15625 [Candidatus Accumulibacter sp.]|nr:hypothetical protein [Accumulibacter sp.]HCN69633.1 hypothetical protein [Accumulibacter sp.]